MFPSVENDPVGSTTIYFLALALIFTTLPHLVFLIPSPSRTINHTNFSLGPLPLLFENNSGSSL